MEEVLKILAHQWFLAIPGFLFVLVIIVFFHELGHFLVARWCGVKVEAFSIGFGREIWAFVDKKGTRWRVAWIPLGGYVKFSGDQNAASVPSEEEIAGMTPEEREGTLQLKPLWQRASIVFAGPLASFLLGIAIFTVSFWLYGKVIHKPVIDRIIAGSPAERAGFKVGDQIITVNGVAITSFRDVVTEVNISGDQELGFVILRNGKNVSLKGKAEISEQKDVMGNRVRRLGIVSESKHRHQVEYNILTASGQAVTETYKIVSTTLRYIGNIVTLKAAPEHLSGPPGIAKLAGIVAARDGLWALLQLAAFMSIAIGLFNLFPIPILDGGHLAFYAVEAVTGKPLSAKAQDIAASMGFAILMLLMVFVIQQDISKWLS